MLKGRATAEATGLTYAKIPLALPGNFRPMLGVSGIVDRNRHLPW